ncbi:hypothetical protein BRADI_3g03760v3 [Brachypodium distachyon]|uniref:Uncharacterized protein n=1 Tax=Brachypodium distachyon TaxID=15368 RepID=I1HX62_BRADI|nr:hypothetical protein BRADI_3g03760v3 [Brachypodium distachyon]
MSCQTATAQLLLSSDADEQTPASSGALAATGCDGGAQPYYSCEPEFSPQVMQVRGSMKQPIFTCKFGCRTNSDLQRSMVRKTPEKKASHLTRGPHP